MNFGNLGNLLNWQVTQTVLRNASAGIGWILIQQGWINDEQNQLLAGAAVAVGTLVFSIVSARFKNAAIEVAGGKDAIKREIAFTREL